MTSISATPAVRWRGRRKEKNNDSHCPCRIHDGPPPAGPGSSTVVHRLHAAATADLSVDLRCPVREGITHTRFRFRFLHHVPDPWRPGDERTVHGGLERDEHPRGHETGHARPV